MNIDKKSLPLILYVLVHLAPVATFAISAICGRFFITSDLFSMIPKTAESAAVEIADKKLTGNSGKSVFILSRATDFVAAKKNAVTAYDQITAHPDFTDFFESLSLYSDARSFTEIFDFLHEYRWNFLSQKQAELLQSAEGQTDFAEESLSNIFGGFSLSPLDDLENDPFFLDETNVRKFLQILQDSGTNMSQKDDVLAAEYDGEWFVMIQGVLTPKGAALAQKKNGIQLIYDVCLPLESSPTEEASPAAVSAPSAGSASANANAPSTASVHADASVHASESLSSPGGTPAPAQFVFSGTPFHSHKSSTSASREITLISTVSLLAVLAILIFTFKSPLPIIAAFSSILISIAFAFTTTVSIFGHIHALTLVFGTSLIGSCIDYSLHFFVNWKANRELKSGEQIKSFLKKGLALSLLSTELCYLLLMFAPFLLLRQMAVFSFAGILSSFLTVMWVYPAFKVQNERLRSIPSFNLYVPKKLLRVVILQGRGSYPKRLHRGLFILIPLALLAFNFKNLKIQNNLTALYKMEGRLKTDTILAAKVLNYTPSSWFVIQADSEEELLQKEEDFAKNFPSKKYICTSKIIPSKKTQKASRTACKNLIKATAAEQFELLDFDDAEARAKALLETLNQNEKLLLPSSSLPNQLKGIISLLWLGNIDGKYYSVFMPTENIPSKTLEALSAPQNGIFYENKVAQIGQGLDHLSKIILLMFAAAYIIILFVLRLFFTAKQTLKIAVVPLFSVISILAVFTATNTPLDFFCITGIILVFGLGIDYIIYMTQHNGGRLERTAIILSFLTTAISFGTLALSNFVPIHVIGLAIFTGLTAAFIATMIF